MSGSGRLSLRSRLLVLLIGVTTTIVGSPVGAGTMVPVPGLDNYDQPADKLNAFQDWVARAGIRKIDFLYRKTSGIFRVATVTVYGR